MLVGIFKDKVSMKQLPLDTLHMYLCGHIPAFLEFLKGQYQSSFRKCNQGTNSDEVSNTELKWNWHDSSAADQV